MKSRIGKMLVGAYGRFDDPMEPAGRQRCGGWRRPGRWVVIAIVVIGIVLAMLVD